MNDSDTTPCQNSLACVSLEKPSVKLITKGWAWGWCLSKWDNSQGEQRALSHKLWVGHTGIHGNSVSGNHPPGTVTLTKSVEILANPILTNSTNEGGKGRGKKQNNWMIYCLKQTAPHTAETNNTCHLRIRSPLCHLKAHDSLTAADQHCIGSILT